MTGIEIADLAQLRNAIDAIDAELVGLLDRRAELAAEVGRRKASRARESPYAPQRELEVYAHVDAVGRGPLAPASRHAIWREIISGCLALEGDLAVAHVAADGGEPVLAAFGDSIPRVPVDDVLTAVSQVREGAQSHAVLAARRLLEHLDEFIESGPKICNELCLAGGQRFWVIGEHPPAPGQHDVTTLAVASSGEPVAEPAPGSGVSLVGTTSSPGSRHTTVVQALGGSDSRTVRRFVDELRGAGHRAVILGVHPRRLHAPRKART